MRADREQGKEGAALRDVMLDELRAEGFDLAGCLPIEQAGDERFAEWLSRGYAGEMGYLHRHLEGKATPERHWPLFRSVLVVAMEYGDVEPPSDDSTVGNISRYALGDDYHEVLKKRLWAAADRLRSRHPDLETHAFVDAGPLNEKLVAQRAGLGWQGKNTNLINEASGSWFFLGVLLTSAVLPATGPAGKDRCGTCTACLPACPTDAFVAPYVLDARRCLSYLTIERKGLFPHEFRRALGARIFGCDDCQEVCPWNRFARRDPPEPFRPRDGLRDRGLSRWLETDLEEWRRLFRRSAVKRIGHEGFLRNVLLACGNARDPALAAAVRPYLGDPSPILRASAAWALVELLGPDALPEIEPLRADPEASVREDLARTLADLPPADRAP